MDFFDPNLLPIINAPYTVVPVPYRSLPLCAMNNLQVNPVEQEVLGSDQPSQMDFLPSSQQVPTNLALPIPSPQVYFDNYHNPRYPNVYPAIHTHADLVNAPFAFPHPIGSLPADHYKILGVTLHDFGYVNNHPEKLFIKYMLWFLEIDDHLMRCICPSDLNDMPCEWDELQGGCPMLRLCKARHKYPHPHVGIIPECTPATQHHCKFIHNIEPNCRSIGDQFRLPAEEQFCTDQLCKVVNRGEYCDRGHDLESARAEAVKEYWRHKEAARAHGSVGFIKWDIWGQHLSWRPPYPLLDE